MRSVSIACAKQNPRFWGFVVVRVMRPPACARPAARPPASAGPLRTRPRDRRRTRVARARWRRSSGRRRAARRARPSARGTEMPSPGRARADQARDRRRAAAVAQVVDEDPADAVLARRSWRRSGRARVFARWLHDRLREVLDGVPVLPRLDRHDDVQALAAAGLQERGQAELVEEGAHQLRPLPASAATRRPRPGRGRTPCGRACRSAVAVAFWVWNSSAFHCAADSSPATSSIAISGGWSGSSAWSSC